MEYSQQKFGTRLRQYRETKGLSRKQLGEISAVHDGYINNLENGQRKSLSYGKLKSLASALNVSMDALLIDSLVKYQKNNHENSGIDKITKEMEVSSVEKIMKFRTALHEFLKYIENK